MAGVNFTSSKFSLYAVVWIIENGAWSPYILDVVSTTLNYTLNQIPEATINVAVGRQVPTGLAANVHYLVGIMQLQLPVQIYMSALEASNSYGIGVESWPIGKFLIFEGYLTGVGSTRTRQQAEYNFVAQHWLTDLNFSSCLTRLTGSLNASQLSTGGAFLPDNGLFPSFLANTLALQYFAPLNITTDFWGSALLPWMLQLCSQDLLVDPDDPLLANPFTRSNFEAARALSRFEPAAPGGYVFGVPLQLDPLLLPESNSITSGLSDAVTAETYDTMANSTLWDKLVGSYGPSFSFAVVPMVSSALVVPLCQGIRRVWQTIYAEEYDYIHLSSELPRAVRGIRLFGGMGSQTGAFGFQEGAAGDPASIGGRYDNPFLMDGMILYANLPSWMANVAPPSFFGAQSANPGGVVSNAFFPMAGQAPGLLNFPPLMRAQGTGLFNSMAMAFYVAQATRGRNAVIHGKLRFDIAPGSSVQMMLNEETFVRMQLGPLGVNSLFGTVQSVQHVIDASQPQASTSFNIGWVRSELENVLEGTSLPGHPFWTMNWAGAPCVDRLEFIPSGQPQILGFGR